MRLTTDRRGFAGGSRADSDRSVAHVGRMVGRGRQGSAGGRSARSASRREAPTQFAQGGARPPLSTPRRWSTWDRDEWDVALADGAVYRIFRDRETDGWFIDAIVD